MRTSRPVRIRRPTRTSRVHSRCQRTAIWMLAQLKITATSPLQTWAMRPRTELMITAPSISLSASLPQKWTCSMTARRILQKRRKMRAVSPFNKSRTWASARRETCWLIHGLAVPGIRIRRASRTRATRTRARRVHRRTKRVSSIWIQTYLSTAVSMATSVMTCWCCIRRRTTLLRSMTPTTNTRYKSTSPKKSSANKSRTATRRNSKKETVCRAQTSLIKCRIWTCQVAPQQIWVKRA